MKHTETAFGFSSIKDSPLPTLEELRYNPTLKEMDNQTLISFMHIRAKISELLTRQLLNDISAPPPPAAAAIGIT